MIEAKTAAAVAGVLRYLAKHAGDAARAGTRPAGGQAGNVSPWALYGRQTIMNQRLRLQARRRK